MHRFYLLIILVYGGIFACIQETTAPPEQYSRRPIPQAPSTEGQGKQGNEQEGLFEGDDDNQYTSPGGLGNEPSVGGTGGGSNGGPPIPDGDMNQVKYMSGSFGSYLSPIQNLPRGQVDFRCPGDSFLVGEKSEWDSEEGSKDRIYQYRCQFLTDGQGVPIRKSSCSLSENITDTVLDFSCPAGKYLAGQVSSFNTQSGDRQYKFECCEARSEQNGKKLAPNVETLQTGEPLEMCTTDEDRIPQQLKSLPDYSKLVNIDVNDRMGELDYNCSDAALLPLGGLEVNFQIIPIPDAILTRVKSTFYPDVQDRRHSFYCCQLQLGGSSN